MKHLARKLRINQTEAEKLLWNRLRNRRLAGCKFRRQHSIGPYIVDFVSLDRKLIIELDGGQHAEAIDYDQVRSNFLQAEGFRVMRFWNNEMFVETDAVLQRIYDEVVGDHVPSPQSSPRGRGSTAPNIYTESLNLRYLTFSSLAFSGLNHGVFTRHGGVSDEPFHSLNVGYHVGDEPDNIASNRASIKKALGFKSMVSVKQVHGDRVLVVSDQPDADYEADGYDALVTNCRTGLMIQQADCQAVLLFDPARQAVGIAHSGWRGSVVNIIGKTVDAMHRAFGSRAGDMWAAISPSLGPCCGEFVNFRDELPAPMHDYQVRDGYFDFWAISRDQLQDAGVRLEKIEMAGQCTVCDQDFFSYRRDRETGRFASVIGLINGKAG